MSYYQDHTHVAPARDQFRSGSSPDSYGSVVGTIEQSTEHPITTQENRIRMERLRSMRLM